MRLHEEAVRLGAERERARLAAGADHAAGARREAAEVLGLAAGGAAGQLGREAGCEQELQAEGERLRPARLLGLLVKQRQLVAEQVVGGRVGVGGVEQPQDRLAGLGAALERGAVLAQGSVGSNGVGLADRAELSAALMQHELHAAERLEAASEARFHPPHALGHGAHAAAVGRV